jgi:hypothetical protein
MPLRQMKATNISFLVATNAQGDIAPERGERGSDHESSSASCGGRHLNEQPRAADGNIPARSEHSNENDETNPSDPPGHFSTGIAALILPEPIDLLTASEGTPPPLKQWHQFLEEPVHMLGGDEGEV